MSNNHQRVLYKILAEKVIAYNAGLAKAMGSVPAGLILAQFLFWQGKGRDIEWFYKTAKELYEETGLTPKQQTNAIKKCRAKGVLIQKLAGIPAKRHFKVDIEKLIELLASLDKRDKQVIPKVRNSIGRNRETNTDSTQDIYTNNRNNLLKKERIILSKKMKEF